MHRKLLSEKSEKYAIKLVPQGGGELIFQTKLNHFKDLKQTPVRKVFKFQADLKGAVAKSFCLLRSQRTLICTLIE